MPSLDSIPHDIQCMIFSYLAKPLAGYALDGTPCTFNLLTELETLTPNGTDLLLTHPFPNLAATCKQLRFAIEGYCHHLLDEHKVVLGNKKLPKLDGEDWELLAASKGKTKAHRQTYRNLWIRRTHERCIFCGNKSRRRAMFDMLVYCCKICDKRKYGTKVSKSKAIGAYKLKPLVWVRPDLVFENSGLRPLKEAKRENMTYLLEKEVTALAAYCKEKDPDRSISNKAVKKYGADAEKLVNENLSKHIFLRDSIHDPLTDVLSDVLLSFQKSGYSYNGR